MTDQPDFVTWASVPTLSPHSIACLMLGIEPSASSASEPMGMRRVPPIPDDVLDVVDPIEWKRAYERFFVPLTAAVDAGVLKCSPNGLPYLSDAISYLRSIAESNGWITELAEYEFYKAVKRQQPDWVTQLEAENSILRLDIEEKDRQLAEATTRKPYMTDELRWLYRAIDEFFSDDPAVIVTGDGIHSWILEQSKREGEVVSSAAAERIAKILTPPERKMGGRPPRR